MRTLFAVDVQPEFALGEKGCTLYKKLVKLIENKNKRYDRVVLSMYVNKDNTNMQTKVHYFELQHPELHLPKDLETHWHSGYCPLTMPKFGKDEHVDVVGFDTDACVLATAYHLFDNDIDFSILVDGVYSSGGDAMHSHGLAIMFRQFGEVVNIETTIDSLLE